MCLCALVGGGGNFLRFMFKTEMCECYSSELVLTQILSGIFGDICHTHKQWVEQNLAFLRNTGISIIYDSDLLRFQRNKTYFFRQIRCLFRASIRK